MRTPFSGVAQFPTTEDALEIVEKVRQGEVPTTEQLAILIFYASDPQVQEALSKLQTETPLE